ncbi:MAG: hypothetical protein KIH63_000050 [Candidatus Saccharibacteria bacterium]|nr:hypothetical protein [Candidatus Saccharibacteria bacterium]
MPFAFKMYRMYSQELLASISANQRRVTTFNVNDDPLEMQRLHSVLGPRTLLGGATLMADLLGGVDPELRQQRQESVDELRADSTTREALTSGLSAVAQNERGLLDFLDGRTDRYTVPRRFYNAARAGVRVITDLAEAVDTSKIETPLLKSTLESLAGYADSDDAKFAVGKVYLTPAGLRPHDSAWRWLPPTRLAYRGSSITGRGLLVGLTSYGALLISKGDTNQAAAVTEATQQAANVLPDWQIALGLSGVMSAGVAAMVNNTGDAIHGPMFIDPVRKRWQADAGLGQAFADYSELDVLQSFANFATVTERNGHDVYQPVVESSDSPYIRADGLKNPILAFTRPANQVTPNDFELTGMTMLTGPNSGGKSTTLKAVLHSQALAEAGGPVVADSFATTPADFMHYMVPGAPNLVDETGRFGYELGELRTVFERATPHSLIGLDDCMDGTTHQERIEILGDIVRGFDTIGGRTVFSTHATELVQQSAQNGIGQQVQVEFKDGEPTYRIIPGVSTTSHADRVARIVGMDRDAIQASLRARGYVE